MRGQRVVAVLAVVLLLAVGCRQQPPSGPAVVKGRVEGADGKPLGKMILRFHALEQSTRPGTSIRSDSALTQADGSFVCECLPGRYKVTLAALPGGTTGAAPAHGKEAPAASSAGKHLPDNIPAMYASSAETPWEIEVPPGGKSDVLLKIRTP
jgi:hypothetical protein